MRTDIAPPLSVSLLQTWPARVDPTTSVQPTRASARPEDDPGNPRKDGEDRPPAERMLVAGQLRIELDEEAGRFVQTLTDPVTKEVLRRFPNESQLAFARATRAYAQALSRR